MSLFLYGKIQDTFLLNSPAFQGLMMVNQYWQKGNCVHLLLLNRLSFWLAGCSGTPPIIQ